MNKRGVNKVSKWKRSKEEKDRPVNPYWNPVDEGYHGMIEDDYGEESGPDSIFEYWKIVRGKKRPKDW